MNLGDSHGISLYIISRSEIPVPIYLFIYIMILLLHSSQTDFQQLNICNIIPRLPSLGDDFFHLEKLVCSIFFSLIKQSSKRLASLAMI